MKFIGLTCRGLLEEYIVLNNGVIINLIKEIKIDQYH